MKTEKLRADAKEFIKKKNVSQNELARRAKIPPGTFSEFMHKQRDLSGTHASTLIKIIAPHKSDVVIAALQIRTMLKKRFFTEDEISKICHIAGLSVK
jgi:plasmid maintenance system antidote protein VapI